MTPIQKALLFLVNLAFNFYLCLLIIRVFLQKLRAHAWNPVCKLILKITDPVVKPSRKLLPGFKGFDLAIVVPAILIQAVGIVLFTLIQGQGWPHFLGTLVLSLALLLRMLSSLFFFTTLINAFASWLAPQSRHPALEIVTLICTPLLKVVRRWVPTYQGIDFSPLIVIIGLKLVDILLIYPLADYAYTLL
jgi:YggT family protein